MDVISFNEASTANSRIESFIENPDSTSGVLTVPKTIAAGETITIPAGRVAVLPNVQVDGTLNIEGDVFIPSGATFSKVVETEGNQTIDGVKTFSSSPIVPTPTNATDAANKAFVDTKANLASPAFTGTVTLPSTTSIGTVSSTELSYLDGVTSGIQTQLNGKAATNQTMYVGTTAMAINRATAAQTLTGVSIDGSSASCTGNATTATTATNFVNSSYGTNSISAGTGDGATRTTYNVKFKSWYGTAYADYSDTVNRVLDHRTGIFYSASGSSFLPEYACRAWTCFDGTGTITPLAGGNVQSITDNGTGDYTVKFTTAMPDANYVVMGTIDREVVNNGTFIAIASMTISSVRILSRVGNGVAIDSHFVSLGVLR